MNAATSANQNPDNTLSRLKSGDDCAFNELVQSNWEKIYNRANGLLGNRQDAEEVAQDTFLRARKSLCNFRTTPPRKRLNRASSSQVSPPRWQPFPQNIPK